MATIKPVAAAKPVSICHNRKARFDYAFDEELEAGLVLTGTEVKSCRAGRAHLNEAYVQVKGGEAFLINSHIAEYSYGNRHNHLPQRARKLLLHARQIVRLQARLQQEGLSAIPLSLSFVRGRAKCTFGVGRGKKAHDKRHAQRERQADREVQRQMRQAQGVSRLGRRDEDA